MSRRAITVGAVLVVILLAILLVLVTDTGENPARTTETATTDRGFPGATNTGFPSATNTGVPDDSTLEPYGGTCALDTPNTTITDARVTCDRLLILAPGIVIRRSVLPRVEVDTPGASVLIEDSVVDGGDYAAPAVGYHDITLRRVEVRGGQTSVLCTSCTIEGSWLHAQMKPQPQQHLGGYLSNGGSSVIVRGNTIECTPEDVPGGGGCTGGAQIFGDFEALADYRFEGNLFVATPGGYCASFGYNPGGKPYGDRPRGIVVADNVFQRGVTGRCGQYGAATSFLQSAPGNVWKDNRWDDGAPLPPP